MEENIIKVLEIFFIDNIFVQFGARNVQQIYTSM